MIRQDYILRQVQELTQRLARAIFLRARGEREAALREVSDALRLVGADDDFQTLDPEAWVKLCRDREELVGPLWVVVADLLEQMAQGLEAEGPGPSGVRSPALARAASLRACGLVLKLEALLRSAVPVTRELLDDLDALAERLDPQAHAVAVASRRFALATARGRWAEAEDALFDWVAAGDDRAGAAGREFYDRLGQEPDSSLEEGGLSRAEVSEGRHDLDRALSGSGAGRGVG